MFLTIRPFQGVLSCQGGRPQA